MEIADLLNGNNGLIILERVGEDKGGIMSRKGQGQACLIDLFPSPSTSPPNERQVGSREWGVAITFTFTASHSSHFTAA